MAPRSPDATARLWIDYSVAGQARTMQYRFADAATATAAAATLRSALDAVKDRFYTSTIFTGARVAAVGTNVSNPVTFASLSGTGAGEQPLWSTPRFHSTVGRSSDGAKVRWYVYGIKTTSETPNDYRITAEEDAAVVAVWTELSGWIEETGVLTIGGLVPVQGSYINMGWNAYHQRALRG